MAPPYDNPYGWVATVTVQRRTSSRDDGVGLTHTVRGS
jgi:hypothetical protein